MGMPAEEMRRTPLAGTQTGGEGLHHLAAMVDVDGARRNPIDGAIVLASMDEELEELEREMQAAQEQRELLHARKVI